MKPDKYKWENRLIIIDTPSYKNEDYIKSKLVYEKNIKEFHKRYIKLLSNRQKDNKFKIKLIGFDGKIKNTFSKLNPNNIFKIVDKMPLGKLMKENPKIKPKNLSLYSDYNKETTIPNLGFKDKEKALYTLNKIKNKSIKYQVNLVSTMIGRAKNHPHITKGMKDAIKIFQKWLDEYHKKK